MICIVATRCFGNSTHTQKSDTNKTIYCTSSSFLYHTLIFSVCRAALQPTRKNVSIMIVRVKCALCNSLKDRGHFPHEPSCYSKHFSSEYGLQTKFSWFIFNIINKYGGCRLQSFSKQETNIVSDDTSALKDNNKICCDFLNIIFKDLNLDSF